MDRRLLEVKNLPYDANLSSKSHHEVVGCANAKSLNVVGAPTASSIPVTLANNNCQLRIIAAITFVKANINANVIILVGGPSCLKVAIFARGKAATTRGAPLHVGITRILLGGELLEPNA